MDIRRLDQNCYMVGAVSITRHYEGVERRSWAALPPPTADDPNPRPLWVSPTLEEALDMAAGAIEMLRPADGYCRHYRLQGDCNDCLIDERNEERNAC